MTKQIQCFALLILLCLNCIASEFDHSHNIYDKLLKRHVYWTNEGHASQVDYAGLKKDKAHLDLYIETLKSVTKAQFNEFSKDEQLSFLINTYNAYTLSWVIEKHTTINTIKNLGTLFRSPWKNKRFQIFGERVSLDYIEHDLIRERGKYDDARIHMAVNCAAVGCPALRPEAFIPSNLSKQLSDNTTRFITDPSRNIFTPEVFSLSKIFKWYRSDFELGSKSVIDWLRVHHPTLEREILKSKEKEIKIKYLDYDWSLNRKSY